MILNNEIVRYVNLYLIIKDYVYSGPGIEHENFLIEVEPFKIYANFKQAFPKALHNGNNLYIIPMNFGKAKELDVAQELSEKNGFSFQKGYDEPLQDVNLVTLQELKDFLLTDNWIN